MESSATGLSCRGEARVKRVERVTEVTEDAPADSSPRHGISGSPLHLRVGLCLVSTLLVVSLSHSVNNGGYICPDAPTIRSAVHIVLAVQGDGMPESLHRLTREP